MAINKDILKILRQVTKMAREILKKDTDIA